MRAPAFLVPFETADGPSPQSAARPTTGRLRMRSKTCGRWCCVVLSSLGLTVEHEYLERAMRVEHDLAVVAEHLTPRELFDRAVHLVGDDLLEPQPVRADHVGLARLEQRHLVLREAALEHHEDDVVVDEALRLRRSLPVQ